MIRRFAIAGLSLMIAACGSPAPDTSRDPEIAVRSAEQNQLHQLSDELRDIALKRAILASRFSCPRVTRSGYVTEHGNLSMWAAECDNGRNWGIFVGPDGSAQVRPCADMATLKLPTCQIQADPSGRTARGIPKQAG